MRHHAKTLLPDLIEPELLHKAFLVAQVCLLLVSQITLLSLSLGVLANFGFSLHSNWLHMHASCAAAMLCASLAMFLTENMRFVQANQLSKILASALIGLAAASLFAHSSRVLFGAGRYPSFVQVTLQGLTVPGLAVAFALLGAAILFSCSSGSLSGRIADLVACGLVLWVIILLLVFVFGKMEISGSPGKSAPSAATMACLLLLTLVIVLRRAEHGFFSILLGSGIGSRMSRILVPILVALPILREFGRARLLNSGVLPSNYVTVILVSITIGISLGLLLLLSRFINRMQNDVQSLSFRDELTGLYNVRGFYLLAEQAFRLARRSKQRFGVLFVDMDNLKTINDELGHSAGSVSIVETAKLLITTFRDTDVIGRIGGDEFVVAGQFEKQGIVAAIARLRSICASRNHFADNRFALSLSIGYAETEHTAGETLKHLITKADKAMYEEKQQKKKAGQASLR